MKRPTKDYSADIDRRIQEKRGAGSGASYRPWLTVRDARRGGFRHRLPSIFEDRNYHLLSNIELQWAQIWSLCPGVVEIREQYPLFPRSKTQSLAANLGLRHPNYPDRTTPLVMTTDLVVFVRRNGKLLIRACAVKPAKKLSERTVINRLSIERAYWESFPSAHFLVLTDEALPRSLARAVHWLYYGRLHRLERPPHFPALEVALKHASREQAFDHACLQMDEMFGTPVGATLSLARQLISRRIWRPDHGGLAALDRLNGGVRCDRRIPLA